MSQIIVMENVASIVAHFQGANHFIRIPWATAFHALAQSYLNVATFVAIAPLRGLTPTRFGCGTIVMVGFWRF